MPKQWQPNSLFFFSSFFPEIATFCWAASHFLHKSTGRGSVNQPNCVHFNLKRWHQTELVAWCSLFSSLSALRIKRYFLRIGQAERFIPILSGFLYCRQHHYKNITAWKDLPVTKAIQASSPCSAVLDEAVSCNRLKELTPSVLLCHEQRRPSDSPL